jgi:chromosome segregation ATPase
MKSAGGTSMSDDEEEFLPTPAPTTSAPKPAPKPASTSVATIDDEKSRKELRDRALGILAEKTTPKPAPVDKSDGLVESFVDIKTKLDSIVGESSGRLVELKLAAAESFDRAFTRLEDEARHVRDSLARNETLAREAMKVVDQARALEAEQEDLEDSVARMQERVKALTARDEQLHDLRSKLESTRDDLEETVRKRVEESSRLQGEVDRFTTRLDDLEEETEKMERVRVKLEEDVSKLTKLREEYMAAIKRLRDSKDELTREAEKG